MDNIPPTKGVPAPICVPLLHTRPRRKQRLCRHIPAATEIIRQGVGVYATRRLQLATSPPWATTEQGAQVHAYQPTAPCRLPCPNDRSTVIFADGSGTTSLTPAAGGAAVELGTDRTGQPPGASTPATAASPRPPPATPGPRGRTPPPPQAPAHLAWWSAPALQELRRWVKWAGGAGRQEGVHMVHTFEEIRTRTPADPNEAAPEAIMPQAAWEAPLRDAVQGLRSPYGPRTLCQWLQATHPRAWAIGAPPPHPTTTTPGREKAQARGGQGAKRDTPARGHRSAQGARQAPIGTGHRERHNVGAGNLPRARKGREQGPGRRERGHHGGHQDLRVLCRPVLSHDFRYFKPLILNLLQCHFENLETTSFL